MIHDDNDDNDDDGGDDDGGDNSESPTCDMEIIIPGDPLFTAYLPPWDPQGSPGTPRDPPGTFKTISNIL